MQGKKNFTPQLFVSVNLLDLVPEDNFFTENCKQTRINGKFNLQLEKILALYHQKTKYFSPSSIPKTREELCFCKNSLFRLQ